MGFRSLYRKANGGACVCGEGDRGTSPLCQFYLAQKTLSRAGKTHKQCAREAREGLSPLSMHSECLEFLILRLSGPFSKLQPSQRDVPKPILQGLSGSIFVGAGSVSRCPPDLRRLAKTSFAHLFSVSTVTAERNPSPKRGRNAKPRAPRCLALLLAE